MEYYIKVGPTQLKAEKMVSLVGLIPDDEIVFANVESQKEMKDEEDEPLPFTPLPKTLTWEQWNALLSEVRKKAGARFSKSNVDVVYLYLLSLNVPLIAIRPPKQ